MSLAPSPAALARAGAMLNVDLRAIVANWRYLKTQAEHAETAAVVKADAYGLGASTVAGALREAGCNTFFVAHLDEGLALRHAVGDARILVLHGPNPGTEAEFTAAHLIPVLSGMSQVQGWLKFVEGHGHSHPTALQVDTGMTRLGLSRPEFDRIRANQNWLRALDPQLLMSHFACADTPRHPLNHQQLETFAAFAKDLPGVPASLSASSGIFIGPRAHFDLVRPGIALYGGNPRPGHDNPMAHVVTLSAKVIQIQDVAPPQTVGYGAAYDVPKPSRLATVALGYADGFLRGITANPDAEPVFGTVHDTWKARLVGRVSMDLTTFDIGEVPEDRIQPGDTIDVIGKYASIDTLADAGRTISYELLTRLGPRLPRIYKNGTAT